MSLLGEILETKCQNGGVLSIKLLAERVGKKWRATALTAQFQSRVEAKIPYSKIEDTSLTKELSGAPPTLGCGQFV